MSKRIRERLRRGERAKKAEGGTTYIQNDLVAQEELLEERDETEEHPYQGEYDADEALGLNDRDEDPEPPEPEIGESDR